MSSFLTTTTLPDAPDAPDDFKVVKATSKTVTLSWNPPKKMNGPLSFYRIQILFDNFNNETISSEETTTGLSLTLNDLQVIHFVFIFLSFMKHAFEFAYIL